MLLDLTLYQLHREYQADLVFIGRGLEQIEKVHLATVTETLCDVNTDKLRTIIKGLSKLHDVSYAAFVENGESLVSVGDQRTAGLDFHILPLVYDIRGSAREIGQIEGCF